MNRTRIIIIGGGAAGLMAADILSPYHDVHIYEKGKAVGRKFLVAGNGGFNLTNNAKNDELISKYSFSEILKKSLTDFDSEATRNWLDELGIATFVGTSGRVFPKEGIKPAHVLKKIKDRLINQQVVFHYHHEFISFSENGIPIIKNDNKEFPIFGDYYIFALGGASWAKTGSDGKWLKALNNFGINTTPFQSSNCGINIKWNKDFKEKHEGTPLKNISISIGDFFIKGEALITEYGLEGNAIYPSIPSIRKQFSSKNDTYIYLDLKPNNSIQSLEEKIVSKNIKPKNYAYTFNLNKCQLDLIKAFTSKEIYINPNLYIKAIKKLKIPVDSLRPMEEAISTIGGIKMNSLNQDFSLKEFSNIFMVGEMLDWDAPTGGYLLQGCFSTAHAAARSILNKK